MSIVHLLLYLLETGLRCCFDRKADCVRKCTFGSHKNPELGKTAMVLDVFWTTCRSLRLHKAIVSFVKRRPQKRGSWSWRASESNGRTGWYRTKSRLHCCAEADLETWRIVRLFYCHTVEGAHTGMRFNGWTFEQNTRLGQTGLDKAWK